MSELSRSLVDAAAAVTYPTIAEPDRVIEWVQTSMWESEGPRRSGGPVGAWLRAWPSGHVHYSEDWVRRTDGRFDTVCQRTRIFWPQADWPKAKVCRQCAAIFRSLTRVEGKRHGHSE